MLGLESKKQLKKLKSTFAYHSYLITHQYVLCNMYLKHANKFETKNIQIAVTEKIKFLLYNL